MKRLLIAAVLSVVTVPAVAMPPLCDVTDDPCVVEQDVDLDEAALDLAGRALVVASGRTIRIATKLVLTAGAVTLTPNARIELPNDGELEVHAAGDVHLEPGSAIVASTFELGRIQIESSGDFVMRGSIRANSASRDGEGGLVFLVGGNVEIAGDGIQAHGGNRYGAGGWIVVGASADVTISMPIVGHGGDGGGAVVEVDAEDDVVVGPAAMIDVSTVGEGIGGEVIVFAVGDVAVSGDLRAVGAGAGASGGDVDIDGTDVSVGGSVDVSATGLDASAGNVTLLASGDLAIGGRIVNLGASSRFGLGGTVGAFADGAMTVTGPIDLSRGVFALLYVDARTLRIAAPVTIAEDLRIQACTIDIAPEGVLTVANFPDRPVTMRASNAIAIRGTLRTSTPAILEWNATPPVIAPGAVVVPPPVLVEDSQLFCPSACGDRFVDGDEQCDDGNRVDGDCCSASCTAEPAGNACDDGRTCTTGDLCDGAGACAATPVVCDACEHCAEGAGCVTGPKAGCHPILVPGGGSLDLKDAPLDAADRLTWRWRLGAATPLDAFGDPLASTDYALCVYDGADLLMRLRAPSGAAWRPSGTRGVRYADGTARMTLLAGDAGEASIAVKGRGVGLPMPALGLDGPVRVQLESSGGACWTSTFSDPSANVTPRYKARSD